jgi:hypothetical protein
LLGEGQDEGVLERINTGYGLVLTLEA